MNGSEHISADDNLKSLDEILRSLPPFARKRHEEQREMMRMHIRDTTAYISQEITTGRLKAHEKHGDNSIEAVNATDFGKWLAILGEEFGEVCSSLTYDKSKTMGDLMTNLRSELVDTATVAMAWIAAVDGWMEPNGDDLEEN